jgi:hypothetical protein
MTAATKLWANVDSLKKYDLVLLACEGDQNAAQKPATSLQAMYDYTKVGGRVFASHWHNYWLERARRRGRTRRCSITSPISPTPSPRRSTRPSPRAAPSPIGS